MAESEPRPGPPPSPGPGSGPKLRPAPPLRVVLDSDPDYFAVDRDQDIVISLASLARGYVLVSYARPGVARVAGLGIPACESIAAASSAEGYILCRCDECQAYLVAAVDPGVALREPLLKAPSAPTR